MTPLVDRNVQQLGEMLLATQSQLPFENHANIEKYVTRANVTFTQADIANATGIPLSRVKAALAEAEKENGVPFLRDARSWHQLTQEEAIEVVKKFGIYPIKQLRETHGDYEVPVVLAHKGKGGTGKTTTTISLATQSALDFVKSKRTLIIDGDPQGSVRHFMVLTDQELTSKNCVASIFKKYSSLSREERLSPKIQKEIRDQLFEDVIFESHIDNLWFIPASMADMEILIMLSMILGQKNNTFDEAITTYKDLIITPLKNDFDIIYIDSSPACDPLTYSLYYASNYLIIPTTGRTQDFRAYQDYLKLSSMILQHVMPSDFKGFNEIRTLTTKHQKHSEQVQRNVGKIASQGSTFTAMIDENKIYEEASKEQLPVQLLSTKAKAHREAVATLNLLHSQVMKMIEPYMFPVVKKEETKQQSEVV